MYNTTKSINLYQSPPQSKTNNAPLLSGLTNLNSILNAMEIGPSICHWLVDGPKNATAPVGLFNFASNTALCPSGLKSKWNGTLKKVHHLDKC